jgi:hypothetical protein
MAWTKQDNYVLVRVQLPDDVHDAIVASAKRNLRSMHGELAWALSQYAADVSATTPIDSYVNAPTTERRSA